MAEIDKNPKQITRLRVEDQKNLESISRRVSARRLTTFKLGIFTASSFPEIASGGTGRIGRSRVLSATRARMANGGTVSAAR